MRSPLKCFLLAGGLLALAGPVPARRKPLPRHHQLGHQPGRGQILRTEEYCQLSTRAQLNGRYVVSIDFGQRQKLLSLNQDLLRDAAGQVLKFNSVMDALNGLNAQGWELASTFVLVEDSKSVPYYVIRRRPPG